MSTDNVNPHLDKIFGDWFKNIQILLVTLGGLVLLIFSLVNGWIGKDFGLNLLFLMVGLILGKWFEHG